MSGPFYHPRSLPHVTESNASAVVVALIEQNDVILLDQLSLSLTALRILLVDAHQVTVPQRFVLDDALRYMQDVRQVLLGIRYTAQQEENREIAYQQRWWSALVPFGRWRSAQRAEQSRLLLGGTDTHLTYNSGFLNAWELHGRVGSFLSRDTIQVLVNEIDLVQTLFAQR